MGSSLVGLHRNEEGIERLEESLATYARMEGEHPSAGWTHLAMGRAIWLTRGCVHAIEHFEAAAEIWMRAHRDTHPYLARPLTAIARCEDRPDAAERARTRLRAVAEAEPDDPVVKAHLAVVEAGDDGALDAARRRLDELGEWIP
jgi:hypothetical protein